MRRGYSSSDREASHLVPPPMRPTGHPHQGCRCVDCRTGEQMARAVIELVDEKAVLEAENAELRERLDRWGISSWTKNDRTDPS